MIYQESIMKVLSFLHLKMGETYGVIKSISKKKLKGEKKEHLLTELNHSWAEEFNNTNNFKNVWNVIEDSSRYAFNSPHAYSMGGDSAYQAWFKAHHTKTFYEEAIRHYQLKNKKDKIDALVKEAIKFWGYKLGDYEFGTDNRKVMGLSTEFIFELPVSPLKEAMNAVDSKKLEGRTFVITGSLNHYTNRDAAKAEILAYGGKVSDTVSAKTSYLVNNDINSSSSKNKKAKSLGIPIITEEELMAMIH